MKDLNELNLSHFTGTENYYKYGIGDLKVLLTDGCKYVAEEAAAYWIFDTILSYQIYAKIRNEDFQHWVLKKQLAGGWLITCDDGNGNMFVEQKISYSDFPLTYIHFYLVGGVYMLKSEY